MEFGFVIVRIIVVRIRPHRHIHFLAVGRERYISRPVPTSAGRTREKLWHNRLHRTGGLQIAIVIRKALYRVRIADVNPLRIITNWIESDSKWLMKARRKG